MEKTRIELAMSYLQSIPAPQRLPRRGDERTRTDVFSMPCWRPPDWTTSPLWAPARCAVVESPLQRWNAARAGGIGRNRTDVSAMRTQRTPAVRRPRCSGSRRNRTPACGLGNRLAAMALDPWRSRRESSPPHWRDKPAASPDAYASVWRSWQDSSLHRRFRRSELYPLSYRSMGVKRRVELLNSGHSRICFRSYFTVPHPSEQCVLGLT